MLSEIIKWIIVILSFTSSSYMTFDGTRAIIKGDYLRPKSGEYAGQLGPWSSLAEKVGIDPISTTMKSIFIVFGVAGLIITTAFALDKPWAWKALLILNICSLWNLFFGTMSSVLQIILLIVLKLIK